MNREKTRGENTGLGADLLIVPIDCDTVKRLLTLQSGPEVSAKKGKHTGGKDVVGLGDYLETNTSTVPMVRAAGEEGNGS